MFPVSRRREPPVHIAARRDHREHDHHHRRVTARQAAEQQGGDEAAGRERQLLVEREWHGEHEVQHHQCEQRDQTRHDPAVPEARVDEAFEPRWFAGLDVLRLRRTHATFLGETAIASTAAISQLPHERKSAAAWLSGS